MPDVAGLVRFSSCSPIQWHEGAYSHIRHTRHTHSVSQGITKAPGHTCTSVMHMGSRCNCMKNMGHMVGAWDIRMLRSIHKQNKKTKTQKKQKTKKQTQQKKTNTERLP